VPSVLIVDDEPNIRRMVGALLHAEGYEVREAADGGAAVRAVAEDEPDVALLDLMMPGELDGLATLAQMRAQRADLPVVMMSGRAALADAVQATRLGAVNFLEKPLAPETVLLALGTALELRQTRRAARALRAELGLLGDMVGTSSAMARVREVIARVAPTESRVLITGESGTGKELVAAAIHERSPRRDRPFVRVNCAAIPRDLVESEMFGHEKGAFTGAAERRIGRFELADTGTLMLDEVGDLSTEAQAKLLRAIEAKEIQRVGGSRTLRVDVRVIAATNRDLDAAVRAGTFREDLLFRLNVLPLDIPPLRERGDDLVELIAHFSALQHQRTGRPSLEWTVDAILAMRSYSWPGNVRELANIVERLAILNDGSAVRGDDVRAVLPGAPRSGATHVAVPADTPRALTDVLDDTERQLITDALREASGNVAEAARRLQTDRGNLYRRMKRLGIVGALLVVAASALVFGPATARAQGASARRDTVPAADTVRVPPTTPLPPFPDTVPDLFAGEERAVQFSPSLSSGKTYNRVEGLPILIGPAMTVETDPVSVDAAAYAVLRTGRGWRLAAPDGGYDAHVALHAGADRALAVQGRLYDVVVPVEHWQLTQPEAGLAAFLLRRDFMDYYGAHGGSLAVTWAATWKVTLFAGVARERWASREAGNPFTLFRANGAWRENAGVDEAVVTRAHAGATIDTRNDTRDPSSGWFITGDVEVGHSGALARRANPNAAEATALAAPAAATYGRGFFDVRRYNRISPRTQLDFRGVFGGWLFGDALPLERRFSLGGPGTLPGYDFRTQPGRGPDILQCDPPGSRPANLPAQCDRVVLGQAELRTELAPHPFGVFNVPALGMRGGGLMMEPVLVLFTDVGRGWRTTQRWGGGYKSDVGGGVDLGLVGVYVAKAITDWAEPANVFVRVRRRF